MAVVPGEGGSVRRSPHPAKTARLDASFASLLERHWLAIGVDDPLPSSLAGHVPGNRVHVGLTDVAGLPSLVLVAEVERSDNPPAADDSQQPQEIGVVRLRQDRAGGDAQGARQLLFFAKSKFA